MSHDYGIPARDREMNPSSEPTGEPMTESTQAAERATSATSRATSTRVGMTARIGYLPTVAKPGTVDSVCVWLADLYGGSPETWGTRMHGGEMSCYRHVARMNDGLRRHGLSDKVGEYMAPVEASGGCTPGPEAEKREGILDGTEDVRQAEWRSNQCEQTLRALLRVRAAERQASLDHDLELIANAPAEWRVTL